MDVTSFPNAGIGILYIHCAEHIQGQTTVALTLLKGQLGYSQVGGGARNGHLVGGAYGLTSSFLRSCCCQLQVAMSDFVKKKIVEKLARYAARDQRV